MESPGTMLQEAREERGLTLEDVAAMTRVPKTMLEHLERDRFEEYEADVFARGHLRNYAQELRIDVDDIIQAYERHTGRGRRDHIEEGGRGDVDAGSGKQGRSAKSKSNLQGKVDIGSGGAMAGLVDKVSGIRRTHLIAVFLGLVGLFVVFGILSDNQVTAQDAAQYEEANEADWELDRDVEETRWLLEQSDSESSD